jgi:hypothetical protein
MKMRQDRVIWQEVFLVFVVCSVFQTQGVATR